jgi:RNA polymerase sigma-70 factor (ECF subfamily)
MDDRELIRRILEGESDTYRILVIRYQRPLFRFLRAFRLPEAVVEELAQETFLRAYRSLASYDSARGATFSTWLFTIAKNLALNESARARTRGEGRGRAGADAAAGEDTRPRDATVDRAAVTDPPQLEALERAERRSMLGRALGALPRAFRSAVVLAYLKELSLDEIAVIERCSVGTVKSRIFRGKRLLAAALSRTEG